MVILRHARLVFDNCLQCAISRLCLCNDMLYKCSKAVLYIYCESLKINNNLSKVYLNECVQPWSHDRSNIIACDGLCIPASKFFKNMVKGTL